MTDRYRLLNLEWNVISTDHDSRSFQDGNGDHDHEVDVRELEGFLALIAHEMNTPLSVAEVAADAALEGYDDLERRDFRNLLEMIKRNVSLASLLMQRISLARDIDRGTVELTLQPVDLVPLIRQAVGDLQLVVLQDHPVETDLPGTLLVAADATALREIVFNLLSNAAKYSAPEAPIEIALKVDGRIAVVAVRNHGRGVTPGDTNVIFEKYFQADSGSEGVGLGLFISRGLARAHGGDLTVKPASDDGSEFRLELPTPT